MLRTLTINSNQSMLSFGVLIAFWSPKQIWDGGEFFGIHVRSIPGQGVRIHYRRTSKQHIWVGITPHCRHFAPGYRHLHPMCTTILHPAAAIYTWMCVAIFYTPAAAIAFGCCALPPGCSRKEFWRRIEKESVSTSPDGRIRILW